MMTSSPRRPDVGGRPGPIGGTTAPGGEPGPGRGAGTRCAGTTSPLIRPRSRGRSIWCTPGSCWSMYPTGPGPWPRWRQRCGPAAGRGRRYRSAATGLPGRQRPRTAAGQPAARRGPGAADAPRRGPALRPDTAAGIARGRPGRCRRGGLFPGRRAGLRPVGGGDHTARARRAARGRVGRRRRNRCAPGRHPRRRTRPDTRAADLGLGTPSGRAPTGSRLVDGPGCSARRVRRTPSRPHRWSRSVCRTCTAPTCRAGWRPNSLGSPERYPPPGTAADPSPSAISARYPRQKRSFNTGSREGTAQL